MKKRHEIIDTATYDLSELKKLIVESKVGITQRCKKEAIRLGYGRSDIIRIVSRLNSNQIYKTMPADKFSELMQDVYHTIEGDDELYIKLQKSADGNRCVIIQFKLL